MIAVGQLVVVRQNAPHLVPARPYRYLAVAKWQVADLTNKFEITVWNQSDVFPPRLYDEQAIGEEWKLGKKSCSLSFSFPSWPVMARHRES
jgi:hypothetical protein